MKPHKISSESGFLQWFSGNDRVMSRATSNTALVIIQLEFCYSLAVPSTNLKTSVEIFLTDESIIRSLVVFICMLCCRVVRGPTFVCRYSEVQYNLARWEDLGVSRQGMFDDTYHYIPTQGWMFLPLIQYHGGEGRRESDLSYAQSVIDSILCQVVLLLSLIHSTLIFSSMSGRLHSILVTEWLPAIGDQGMCVWMHSVCISIACPFILEGRTKPV